MKCKGSLSTMNNFKSTLLMNGLNGSSKTRRIPAKDVSEESILESALGVLLIFGFCFVLMAILIGLSPTSHAAVPEETSHKEISSNTAQDQLGRLWGFWFREKEYKGYGDYAELPQKVRDFVKMEPNHE